MRILIIEDNEKLAESLQDILRGQRYESDVCYDGGTGLESLLSGIYDGAVLDVMLPVMDGLTLLKEARRRKCRTPVLMLTAKSEIEDRCMGLESGADYYLTKPFHMEELIAALKAILRRGNGLIPEKLEYGGLTLDQSVYTVSCNGKTLSLGRREYEVLQLLMLNRETVVSKETLILKIWGNDSDATDNNVEIYISFLRKKLEFLKSEVCIVTKRNQGYCLETKKE